MKKALPAAIALAGSLGFAAAANAVNVNHDGVGEVLLYPLYTVESGNDTLISVTNTTGVAKVVKVRFLEGMNSQEVLDFNLYLSPEDVWTAAITRSDAGAKLITGDTSCTVPTIPSGGVEFRNLQYQGTSYSAGKGGPQGTDRTRVGYVEVIEMGVLTNANETSSTAFNPALWATHVAGKPANCAALSAAWAPGTGTWTKATPGPNYQVTSPTGGLYGTGIIVDVQGGTDVAYDATAIDNWAQVDLAGAGLPQHTAPGSLSPSIKDGDIEVAFDDGTTALAADGADAVSAALMKAAIFNDYLIDAALNAGTDWVVTFPTKKFYSAVWIDAVNNLTGQPPADGVPDITNDPEPFTQFWNSTLGGSACEPILLNFWDREETKPGPGGIDFSPTPPGESLPTLCWETNVLNLNGTGILGGGYVSAELDLPAGFDEGWIRNDFTGTYKSAQNRVDYDRVLSLSGATTVGLPAIGFAAISFTNGDVGGLLSNYAGLTNHKSAGGLTSVTN